MQKIVVVVPCFNEEQRLEFGNFAPLLQREGLELLFVNDGSSDGTARKLEALVRAGVKFLDLGTNRGKGEAVRRGMNHALEEGATVVGYMDADASTPAVEVLRVLQQMLQNQAEVAMGSRIRLLGNRVHRNRARHYLGRLFATFASLALELPVYDTQCGAKFFRASSTLGWALQAPFSSRWAFDVELMGRLLTGGPGAPPLSPERFIEVPLQVWHDAGGSKLTRIAMVRSGLELLSIARTIRRRRGEGQGAESTRS